MTNHPLAVSRIAGADVAPVGVTRFDTINPANGERMAEIVPADAAAIDLAVTSAATAQRQWMAMSAAERGRVLGRIASLLRHRKMDLAALEVADTGKPIQEAPEACLLYTSPSPRD